MQVNVAGISHGGVRGFRWPQILGCYVTKCAPNKALNIIGVMQVLEVVSPLVLWCFVLNPHCRPR